ncbi:phosphopantetheine-binding protein [Streptomyces sp. KL116D]|uniref:phosphopantetheine-binding protein n=1 Tax=Streptomyces sp. KL116D TaxID=3045152 RepID=UPI003557F8BE
MDQQARAFERAGVAGAGDRRAVGEHLDGRTVGVDDDFFALGGNSLTGIKIIDRVAQDYDVRLSVRDFYLAQTPARVAELIERARAAA